MSDNPYTPPSADLASDATFGRVDATGDIDIGRCLSDAWAATWENFPLWLGVGLVGSVAMLLASMTLIGIPLLLPHLFWGAYWFVLRMHDGEAEFGDLFAGFSRYTVVLGSMLVAWLGLLAINLLFQSVQLVGVALESPTLIGVGYLLTFGFALFVSPRLSMCFFYIVDQDRGGIESLQQAWATTAQVTWWVLPVMVLLTFVIVIVGALLLLVGIIPATAISYLMWASAYRQLEGRPAAA